MIVKGLLSESIDLDLLVAVLSFWGRHLTDLLHGSQSLRVCSELVSQTGGGGVVRLPCDVPGSSGELSGEQRDQTGSVVRHLPTHLLPVKPGHRGEIWTVAGVGTLSQH